MPAPPPRWRRRLVGAFTERLGLKAVAIVFAIVLWFIATSTEPTEEIVPVRLALALDTGRVLRDPAPEVHALVAGEGKEIFALYAHPPMISRRVPGGADSTTLELSPDDVVLPPGVTALVRDVQPHTVVVHVTARRP
ncbi:MAG TPA: hypothetical protein VNE60_09040 [Gemmatimonadaceae bacterium]|nr:hypothetical protein [Gemmatimonadaceae bacterium]